jgi:hypothetical protein
MKKIALLLSVVFLTFSCSKEDVEKALGTGIELNFDGMETTGLDNALVFYSTDDAFGTTAKGNFDDDDASKGKYSLVVYVDKKFNVGDKITLPSTDSAVMFEYTNGDNVTTSYLSSTGSITRTEDDILHIDVQLLNTASPLDGSKSLVAKLNASTVLNEPLPTTK